MNDAELKRYFEQFGEVAAAEVCGGRGWVCEVWREGVGGCVERDFTCRVVVEEVCVCVCVRACVHVCVCVCVCVW